MKNLSLVSRFLMTIALGYLILLNCQPWLELAVGMVTEIKIVPFVSVLTSIPFLGGILIWIAYNGSSLLGVCCWGLCQLFQILPGLLKNPNFISRMLVKYEDSQHQKRGDNLDKLRDQHNNYLLKYFGYFDILRWLCYAFEALICFLRYSTIYQGGLERLMQDSPNWDLASIDWITMCYFLMTMFGFEICFTVGIKLWMGMDYPLPAPETSSHGSARQGRKHTSKV